MAGIAHRLWNISLPVRQACQREMLVIFDSFLLFAWLFCLRFSGNAGDFRFILIVRLVILFKVFRELKWLWGLAVAALLLPAVWSIMLVCVIGVTSAAVGLNCIAFQEFSFAKLHARLLWTSKLSDMVYRPCSSLVLHCCSHFFFVYYIAE